MRIPFPPPYLTLFEFSRLVAELECALVRGLVEKVYLSGSGTLAVSIYRGGESRWLCVSTRREFPWLFVSQTRPEEMPTSPPPFAALLRSRIQGGRVMEIRQVAEDRTIQIQISRGQETFHLILEIRGKRVQAVLTDAHQKVLGILVRPPSRDLELGKTYPCPIPPPGVSPESPDVQNRLEDIERSAGKERLKSIRSLARDIRGFSALLAAELETRVSRDEASPHEVLQSLLEEPLRRETLLYLDTSGLPLLVSCFHLTCLEEDYRVENCDSLLEGLRRVAQEALPRAEFLAKHSRLIRDLHEEEKRLLRDLARAEEDQARAECERHFRLCGEMILAHPGLVRRGMQKVTLPDLYGEPGAEIEISLDPKRSRSENAERYFQKAAKAARTFKGAALRIKTLKDRAASVRELQAETEAAPDLQTLRNLEERSARVLPRKAPRAVSFPVKEDGTILSLARVYHSADDLQILVAKGAKQADQLLRRHCRGNDLWCHTRDGPGSHVIVRNPRKGLPVPSESRLDAAHLAAYHSKARGEKNVPLYMTEVKHLRRPRGGPPGKVIVTQDRGFDLRVEEARLERLLKGPA